MKIIIIAAAILIASGCAEQSQSRTTADQCLRAELFQQCMRTIPAGPRVTQENDWEEVVEACASAAYYQSLRNISSITPECRP